MLNEQRPERRRALAERTWDAPDWSLWAVLSWIAFRDKTKIRKIEDESTLRQVICYADSSLKDSSPERSLLLALKRDELAAVKDGEVLRATYWYLEEKVDRDVSFSRESVLHCYPEFGQSEAGALSKHLPKNASAPVVKKQKKRKTPGPEKGTRRYTDDNKIIPLAAEIYRTEGGTKHAAVLKAAEQLRLQLACQTEASAARRLVSGLAKYLDQSARH